jgi:hypothetical protein
MLLPEVIRTEASRLKNYQENEKEEKEKKEVREIEMEEVTN